ncbi:MAG: PLP-dependent aminotransferase family protein, partial [Rhodospirillaceae bacterium]|nr:PLP-dependent aminotransferase family protein [Rhodospirillaceae bacterium]
LSTQLYEQVRDLILSGRLAQGVRLPATRTLAGELGVSRNTVVAAFDQLFAEGFLDGKVGSGTYVTTGALFSPERREQQSLTDRPGPSARGRSLAALAPPRSRHHRAFAVGVSAVDQFPFALWSRLLGQTWRAPGGDTMALGVPGGYQPLREAIARYLAVARAVVCTPEQVIITSGVQQAIALTCQALLDPGDRAWVEDPGYPGVTGALAGAGVSTVQVPVDDEGLCPVQGEALAPDARLACIAPSHHYPLGTVMSLTRRHALIDWAQRADGWILEDDYDSEFRYRGRPLASLQGLDRSGRVIYAGSFSKVMFPSLRLGYLVVPDHLVEIFLRVRAALDDHASLAAQPALARFMDEGHFASHIRRMRRLYGARQEYLLAAAERHLGGLLRLAPDDAGMHLLAMLEPALAERMGDAEAARLASKAGVSAVALSTYTTNVVVKPGLVLGYAAVDENESEAATQRLAQALS